MFKKKENGFSLVELSVAAAIAVALAVVAVTVVSGTATSVSQKGTSAASVESCTISESLTKAGGDVTPINCGGAAQAGSLTVSYATNFIASSESYAWPWTASTKHLSVAGLSIANAEAIINAINNGATKVEFGPYSGNIVATAEAFSNTWPGGTIPAGGKAVMTLDSGYGGYVVAISIVWDGGVTPPNQGWMSWSTTIIHPLKIS
jgi:prepilin-type N-terminal cleavage/methylation domain-containing protein